MAATKKKEDDAKFPTVTEGGSCEQCEAEDTPAAKSMPQEKFMSTEITLPAGHLVGPRFGANHFLVGEVVEVTVGGNIFFNSLLTIHET